MIPYGGVGRSAVHALLALSEAAIRDGRVILLDTLEVEEVREVGCGPAVLYRVQVDTYPEERT